MKRHLPLLLLCLLAPLAAQDFEVSETCTDCHDDMMDFTTHTYHQPAFKVNCEDCHGDMEEHVDDPTLENAYVPSGLEGQKACLSCHAKDKHQPIPAVNMHAMANVYCTDCHLGHPLPSNKKLAVATANLTRHDTVSKQCMSCHAEQRVMQHKPYTHKLGVGGMSCVSCHDPHGGKGRDSLKAADTGELVCMTCHAEKKGPFIYEHVTGTTGDCLDCHEHHGSSNPKQLTRARIHQVCLECHTTTIPASTLGSQPPNFHDIRLPRYQNCSVCHTAVHGSNRSPRLLK